MGEGKGEKRRGERRGKESKEEERDIIVSAEQSMLLSSLFPGSVALSKVSAARLVVTGLATSPEPPAPLGVFISLLF